VPEIAGEVFEYGQGGDGHGGDGEEPERTTGLCAV